MKMNYTKATFLALALGASFATFGTAKAQNTNYAPGGLVLYFQNPNGTQGASSAVMVSLGDGSVFRDATTSIMNIANIGSVLGTTYGNNWYEQTGLFMGVAGNRGTTSANFQQNGDPFRTIYIGQSRDGVGTAGSANSVGYSVSSYGAATDINGMNNKLETLATTQTAVLTLTESLVGTYNPVSLSDVQGTAFGLFPGGVQYQFGSGVFGTFGTAGIVEGALDLYRIQERNNVTNQYGFGEATGIGEYLGSIVIDQAGNVSFIVNAETVPEPSSAALLGVAGALVLAVRRRRAQA